MGVIFVFFNDTATTEIYTLSLHDALPIWTGRGSRTAPRRSSCTWGWGGSTRSPPSWSLAAATPRRRSPASGGAPRRSEEHTSELQSRQYLVCRLLLEKKKKCVFSHSLTDY